VLKEVKEKVEELKKIGGATEEPTEEAKSEEANSEE
jgi:hypothetical protein